MTERKLGELLAELIRLRGLTRQLRDQDGWCFLGDVRTEINQLDSGLALMQTSLGKSDAGVEEISDHYVVVRAGEDPSGHVPVRGLSGLRERMSTFALRGEPGDYQVMREDTHGSWIPWGRAEVMGPGAWVVTSSVGLSMGPGYTIA